MEKNEESINCIICMSFPKLPVATPCGHIFCWNCLKGWVDRQTTIECPVCKNGFEMSKVTKLFMGAENSLENDDRPKTEYRQAVPNNERPGFIHNVLSAFGFYGVRATNENNINLPTDKEVKVNTLSIIMLVVSIALIVFVFNS